MTFSHEAGDGLVKNNIGNAGVVGHWVLLHVFEGRQPHNVVDDIIREGQVHVLHDTFHFASGILHGKVTAGYVPKKLLAD